MDQPPIGKLSLFLRIHAMPTSPTSVMPFYPICCSIASSNTVQNAPGSVHTCNIGRQNFHHLNHSIGLLNEYIESEILPIVNTSIRLPMFHANRPGPTGPPHPRVDSARYLKQRPKRDVLVFRYQSIVVVY